MDYAISCAIKGAIDFSDWIERVEYACVSKVDHAVYRKYFDKGFTPAAAMTAVDADALARQEQPDFA